MADDFNMEANISADVSQYVAAIDRAIDANIKLASAMGLTGSQVDAIDKKLNSVRKTVTGSTNDTLAQEKALKKSEAAWNRQNRIYDDYLKHQARGTAGATANAAAVSTQAAAVGNLEGNLIRARYALYDVATSYAAVAAATLGAVTATTLMAVKYETAFTEIERTTLTTAGTVSSSVGALREQFLDLSEVMPLAFSELTNIGSLGAQLGIAEQDLVSFTETVAQFSKLSGVSSEQTALAFGRIGELLNVSASEYVNLGSAIAANAVSAASTEAQIISLTKEISAGAAGAGLAVDEVIGLASALASLGVAPERARGALSTYYGTLNRAVAEGGQSLQDFAEITGFTAEQLDNLVRSGEGGQVLQAFIQGLSDLDNVGTTQALDRLGLAQLRVSDTFVRLGQNVDFVTEQLSIAENAYANGTFLGDAYSVVLDDVASQFQLLLNSIGRFLAEAGQPFLEFLRVALPLASDFFTALSEFAATDLGRGFFAISGGILAVVGAIAAVRGVAALATASIFAIRTAATILGGTGVLASINAMRNALLGANGAALTLSGTLAGVAKGLGFAAAAAILLDQAFNGGAGATQILGAELGGLLNDLYRVGNGFQYIYAAVTGDMELVRDSVAAVARVFGGVADVANGVLTFIGELAQGLVGEFEELRQLNPIFGGLADSINFLLGPIFNVINGLRLLTSEGLRASAIAAAAGRGTIGRANAGSKSTSTPAGADFSDATDSAEDYAAALGSVGGAAGGAAQQVRTLVDYANDLSGVFGRAFDIRFGSQLAVDEVADSWETLAERIRDARIALQQLTAEKRVKEYFLSVANAYGDELRAGVLRGEIAEINEKMAETQADASTELEGTSKAARQNRGVITGLVQNYQSYITALAASGADQATLNAAVAKSEAEFLKQGRALGFTDAQLKPYIASFRDMAIVLKNIPRNITVTANANPAIQALNEYNAALNATRRNASAGVPAVTPYVAKARYEAIAIAASDRSLFQRSLNAGTLQGYLRGNTWYKYLGTYAQGGYTGAGGKYEPAGVVHRGEYVVPKQHVDQSTGLPKPGFMGATGSQMPASRGPSYASGGIVGTSGGMMVELGPKSLNVMRDAISREVAVYVDSMEIARAANRGNAKMTAFGGS